MQGGGKEETLEIFHIRTGIQRQRILLGAVTQGWPGIFSMTESAEEEEGEGDQMETHKLREECFWGCRGSPGNTVRVSLNYQLPWSLNHLEDSLMGVSMKEFPGRFSKDGKCLPDRSGASWPLLLLECLCHHDGLHPQPVSQKNP